MGWRPRLTGTMFNIMTRATFILITALTLACGADDSDPMPDDDTASSESSGAPEWPHPDDVAAPHPGESSESGSDDGLDVRDIQNVPQPVSIGLSYTDGGDCDCFDTDTDGDTDGCGSESDDTSSTSDTGDACAATWECLDACADSCNIDCLWGCWLPSPDCLGTACIELGCDVCP